MQAPWQDSSHPGTPQYPPGGRYPNRTLVFTPVTNDTTPAPFNGKYYLFNISGDPTETTNLAERLPEKLAQMVSVYNTYARDASLSLSQPLYFHI